MKMLEWQQKPVLNNIQRLKVDMTVLTEKKKKRKEQEKMGKWRTQLQRNQ